MTKRNITRITLASTCVAIISASITFAFQKPGSASLLNGTSWQLVKYKDFDDVIHTPDEKSKYTIKFGKDGRVVTRVDCNRASSTWKVNSKGELQFGSWSRTTTKCGTGSLHDVIVDEGQNVRNFEIKDGRLFLWGMSKGGYYELEPIK